MSGHRKGSASRVEAPQRAPGHRATSRMAPFAAHISGNGTLSKPSEGSARFRQSVAQWLTERQWRRAGTQFPGPGALLLRTAKPSAVQSTSTSNPVSKRRPSRPFSSVTCQRGIVGGLIAQQRRPAGGGCNPPPEPCRRRFSLQAVAQHEDRCPAGRPEAEPARGGKNRWRIFGAPSTGDHRRHRLAGDRFFDRPAELGGIGQASTISRSGSKPKRPSPSACSSVSCAPR